MLTAEDFEGLSRRELLDRMRAGAPIDAAAIAGFGYLGVSLGLPAIADRLFWKTFMKCFHADSLTGVVRGWNVRLVQNGVRGAVEPMRASNGDPKTFGHFEVVSARGRRVPHGIEQGLVLDYGWSGRVRSPVRDPIVAIHAGSAELLLGWSYMEVGPLRTPTPSFFTLTRVALLDHIPPSPVS